MPNKLLDAFQFRSCLWVKVSKGEPVNGLPIYVTVYATMVPIFRTLHSSTAEKVSSHCMHHVYHNYNNYHHHSDIRKS